MTSYTYLGDRYTDPDLKRARCTAVLDEGGKCIRGKGSMLVEFAPNRRAVVIGKLLRKIKPAAS